MIRERAEGRTGGRGEGRGEGERSGRGERRGEARGERRGDAREEMENERRSEMNAERISQASPPPPECAVPFDGPLEVEIILTAECLECDSGDMSEGLATPPETGAGLPLGMM